MIAGQVGSGTDLPFSDKRHWDPSYRITRLVFCVLRALYADFPLRATGSLLALIDFTRSADDAPSSDNP
jgi:hypothetical protein